MSSINNNQQQISGAGGQSVPALPGQSAGGTNTGETGSVADAKAKLQFESEAAADTSANKRIKELAAQGPQDVSATRIAQMQTATGAAGLGSSVPVLPMNKIANPAATAREASAALAGLTSSGIMAYSEIYAFQIMREAGEKSFDAQAKAHQVNQMGQISAQMDSAIQAAKKAQADKSSAIATFLGSAVAVGTTAHMAAKGSGSPVSKENGIKNSPAKAPLSSDVNAPSASSQSLSKEQRREAQRKAKDSERAESVQEDAMSVSAGEKGKEKAIKRADVEEHKEGVREHSEDGHEKTDASLGTGDNAAKRAGMYAASAGAGQLVTSGTEAVNQNFLFGKDSHEAEIAGKYDDALSAFYKIGEESSKAGKEKAQKMIDDALSALKQHFDLVKSTNDRIG